VARTFWRRPADTSSAQKPGFFEKPGFWAPIACIRSAAVEYYWPARIGHVKEDEPMGKRKTADGPKSTRREFAKSLALLAAAPLAAEAAEKPEAKPVPEPVASARTLVEVVRRRYGKHLNAEQLKQVQEGIARGLRTAELMKRQPLKNGDEPAFMFSAEV
jgi:hypothetical protein